MAARFPPVIPVPVSLQPAIAAAFNPLAPALQHQDELTQLIVWALDHGCSFSVCVEIGTHFGGTLACWAEMSWCSPSCAPPIVIGIDLPLGEGGPAEWGGISRERTLERNRAFELKYPHVKNIVGNSHNDDTVDELKTLLAGRPIDFLFIDGDHTWEGVSADFRLYSPLVRSGGIVAFHDINPSIRNEQQNFGVPDFFQLLPAARREVFSVGANWGGIGAYLV